MPNGMAKGYIHTGSVHRAGKQRQTRPALGRRAVVLVALMALVAGTRGAYAQGPLPGRGPGAQGAHVDKKLSDQIDKGKDTDLLRAIMRTRPGARGGLLNAVRAQRGRVSHDFALIEAFAGELPVGLLRALQRHQDVLALSVDGDVTSFAVTTPVGTTYTVTNTNNSGAGFWWEKGARPKDICTMTCVGAITFSAKDGVVNTPADVNRHIYQEEGER